MQHDTHHHLFICFSSEFEDNELDGDNDENLYLEAMDVNFITCDLFIFIFFFIGKKKKGLYYKFY